EIGIAIGNASAIATHWLVRYAARNLGRSADSLAKPAYSAWIMGMIGAFVGKLASSLPTAYWPSTPVPRRPPMRNRSACQLSMFTALLRLIQPENARIWRQFPSPSAGR